MFHKFRNKSKKIEIGVRVTPLKSVEHQFHLENGIPKDFRCKFGWTKNSRGNNPKPNIYIDVPYKVRISSPIISQFIKKRSMGSMN